MTAFPNSGSLAVCVSAINYLMSTFLSNAVWTRSVSFRKHERAELRTLLLHDDGHASVLKSSTEVRDGRGIQHVPAPSEI
jgi:hypothetical protein